MPTIILLLQKWRPDFNGQLAISAMMLFLNLYVDLGHLYSSYRLILITFNSLSDIKVESCNYNAPGDCHFSFVFYLVLYGQFSEHPHPSSW